MNRFLKYMLTKIIRQGTLQISAGPTCSFMVGDGSGTPIAIAFPNRWKLVWLLLDPELRLGEAYMNGDLKIDSGVLSEFIDLVASNLAGRPPSRWAAALRKFRGLRRRLFHNTFMRALRNSKHHYEVDFRIYKLFLGSDYQYSCAYFEPENVDIDEAQRAKMRHIADKLLLKPGLRVLDIGSGWGGLGLQLAREHGCSVLGVTLSDEQIKIARERAHGLGLGNRVAFEIADYRNLRITKRPNNSVPHGNTGVEFDITPKRNGRHNLINVKHEFDRIVSVGMFEHVGRNYYKTFFRKCRDLLSDDGVMLVHTVGQLDGPSETNAWVSRRIFPGGYAPALSELAPAIEHSGLILADVEVLRLHYAHTLRAWRTAFLSNRDEVIKLFEKDRKLVERFKSADRFIRMWEFYLAGFEASFKFQGLAVFQILLEKRLGSLPLTRDYMYERKALRRPVSLVSSR